MMETGTPTWDYVKRIKDATSMKVLIKGIVTKEDAELAVQHGVSGMFVSNHGGRAENSTRATINSLPEVVAGVRGRVPVIVDGGFRRGTDFFKALALGATAAGIGRPYIWGLGSFGQEGVETVLAILRRELELVMKQAGRCQSSASRANTWWRTTRSRRAASRSASRPTRPCSIQRARLRDRRRTCRVRSGRRCAR